MKLEQAIIDENLNRLKEILIEEPNSIDKLNSEGIPMSFLAAKTGNLDIVRYIVEYSRASMNTVDAKNRNILHYGVVLGNLDLIQYLVEKVGMSPVTGDKGLMTPFDLAYKLNHQQVVQYFEQVCGAPYEQMYRNPIRTGTFPDPSIVRVGEDYYMVNSSFIYFPCIPISHSKDLINWRIIGHAITNPEWSYLDELEGGRGYWAPDISYYEGKFYITATYRLNDTGPIYRKQIVVSSDKAEGPYSEPIFIDEDGIDPSIFNDDDGKRYMLLNRGARIFELNKYATKQISEAKLLYYGDQKRAPEAPHLLKKDGHYYLFLAEGGTGIGHRITVSRSKTLLGNYQPCPYNPIMRQWDEEAGIQRCGHGKPVETQNGQWYMVYLCGRMVDDKYTILGRETALDPIEWTRDGWPIVNNLNGPSVLQVKPNLPEEVWVNEDFDYFAGNKLSPYWMFPRSPEPDAYRLSASGLSLKGSKAPLSSMDSRNIIVRRQNHFVFSAETYMKYNDLKANQDAGMICYYDENTWLKFGVFGMENGSSILKVVEHIGDEDNESDKQFQIGSEIKEIYLRINTNYLKREFLYSLDNETYHKFTRIKNVYYLSDEGLDRGKRFTGAMVGLYGYRGHDDLYVNYEYFNYKGQERLE